MERKDPTKEKFQAHRTKGRVEIEGVSENAFEDEEMLEQRWESSGLNLPGWVLAVVVGALVAVVVVVIVAYRNSANPSVVRPEAAPEPAVVEKLSFLEKASNEEVQRAVKETVSGFMNAGSNVERCRYVLGGGRLEEKMEDYYSRYGSSSQPQGFGKIQSAEQAVFSGEAIMIVLAVERTGKKAWMYSLVSEGEGVKIDWETSVSYGEYSWPRFLREKPKSKTQMRVYLKRLPSFKATRKLPDKATAYEVTALGEKGSSVVYTAKGSEVSKELDEIVPDQLKHPVNLFLSWSEKGELQIEELIHNFWTDPERKKNE